MPTPRFSSDDAARVTNVPVGSEPSGPRSGTGCPSTITGSRVAGFTTTGGIVVTKGMVVTSGIVAA
jgi:hypothetical protein